MDDNPYRSPNSPGKAAEKTPRSLLWRLMYDPLHPISFLLLAVFLYLVLAVVFALLG